MFDENAGLTKLQEQIRERLELLENSVKSLKAKPANPKTPGAWCPFCDRPKTSCICPAGDGGDEEELDAEVKLDEELKLVESLLSASDLDRKESCETLKQSLLQCKALKKALKNTPDFTISEQEKYLQMLAYLAETNRDIIGLDGQKLNDLAIRDLMKNMFLLIPDALDLENEEVYAILQSHDFQKLADNYAAFRMNINDPEVERILDDGVIFKYDEQLGGQKLQFHQLEDKALKFKIENKLCLLRPNGESLSSEDTEKLLSCAPFHSMANQISKFNQYMRPDIKERIVPIIKKEDVVRRAMVDAKGCCGLTSGAQNMLMKDRLSQFLEAESSVRTRPIPTPSMPPRGGEQKK